MLWITPSLRVTGENTHPEAAFAIIKSGGIADVVNIDAACDVMELLGMSVEQIEDRVHFALTGQVLHSV